MAMAQPRTQQPHRARGGMLAASIPLGRVAGVAVGLHYSWFIIAALIALSLGARFSAINPEWPAMLVWGAAVLTSILFFVTLLAHELSHAMVAQARGLPVRSITLFALGGVAQIEKDANSAKTEFLVAIVGPITSLVIGIVCMGIARSMGWTVGGGTTSATAAILGWLGWINVVLAVFNLIPGYPLDGGRVLRSILWAAYHDMDRASRHAARAGQIVAGLFILFGLFQFFAGAGFSGLWLAFIGWFLLSAAGASYAQVTITESLRDVRVGDVMSHDCATVDPATNLQAFVDDLVLRAGRRCAMVGSDGHVVGLVTPADVRTIDRARWPELTVRDAMRPLDSLQTVTRETPLSDALMVMAREDVNQLPVMDQSHLEGVVSRGQILQLIQARSELAGGR